MRYITIFVTAIVLIACGNPMNSDNVNSTKGEKQQESANNTEETNTTVDNNVEENDIENDVENNNNNDTKENKENTSSENDGTIANYDEFKQLEEFDAINDTIDLEHATLAIVEDNYGKRVLLVTNDKGIETHKTIYIKNKNRLKIIEFDKGQIFNEVI